MNLCACNLLKHIFLEAGCVSGVRPGALEPDPAEHAGAALFRAVLAARMHGSVNPSSQSNPNMNGNRLSVGSGLVLSSQVRKNTLEPHWDEEFRLLVRDPAKQRLEVDLYDWDRFNADDHIGRSVRSSTWCAGSLPLLPLTNAGWPLLHVLENAWMHSSWYAPLLCCFH